MAFSALFCSNHLHLLHLNPKPKLCSVNVHWKQKLSGRYVTSGKRRVRSLGLVRAALQDGKQSGVNGNGLSEPARILLERLFAQTQKLEERMSRDSGVGKDVQFGYNLEILESDLQAVLAALKKKEEDLADAERRVCLEHSELNRAKEELLQREREIDVACSRHEKLEEELGESNLKLVSQARHLEDLKLQLKERDQEIAAVQSALSLKEFELEKMRSELVKKSDEAAKIDSELKSKAWMLIEVNEVVKKQETEIQSLRKVIREKEEELEVSVALRKVEEEKLKVVEANLEKRTMEWLLSQDALKKLAEEASRRMEETNVTLEDFRRVKKLLSDVRSKLVSSQKSLASSRKQMEEQEHLLEKQLVELEEQKKSLTSYMTSLKDAKIEVESERVKLRVTEARNKELERDLSMEKELVDELQNELNKEKSSLQQAIHEVTSLQEELERKNSEFGETQNLLKVKESDLVEAKLEIQNLKSKQVSLQLILEEKDFELSNARQMLEELNNEVRELKMIMSRREEQLVQATDMLQEKDEHVLILQNELDGTKLKVSEAETVVERIVDLTNKLVISSKNDESNTSMPTDDVGLELMQQGLDKGNDNFRLQTKQLEIELKFATENLRMKEMEVLAAKRVLTIKDEELKTVLGRLDAQEKELNRLKEETVEDANDLRKLYALAQERIGEKSVGDLATEWLQLEAAQLEVEAATSALQKLAEMSGELLNNASLSIETNTDNTIFPQSRFDPKISVIENNECLTEVGSEVARLSVLTEQLVKEAGIVDGQTS